MSDKVILLVEDNPDDEALTLRALKKNNILNEVVVARDGEVGLLEDFIVESETWVINYLLVTTRNWPPRRKALLAPSWIMSVAGDTCEIKVDLKSDTIRNSPEFSPQVLKR